MRTNVYIDSFNLYYGALKGTPYRWLNVAKFAAGLLQADDEINRIRFFTARVEGRKPDLQQPERQQAYLRALLTIPNLSIHYGQFLTKPKRSVLANPPASGPKSVLVLNTEEKGSDVNLASHLMMDAFDNDFELALVISNDSDLVEPIRMVRERLQRPVGVVLPVLNAGRSPSQELIRVATFARRITNARKRHRLLLSCQFPDTISVGGDAIRKPDRW